MGGAMGNSSSIAQQKHEVARPHVLLSPRPPLGVAINLGTNSITKVDLPILSTLTGSTFDGWLLTAWGGVPTRRFTRNCTGGRPVGRTAQIARRVSCPPFRRSFATHCQERPSICVGLTVPRMCRRP